MTENEAIKKVKEFGLYHAIGDLPNSMLTVKAFEMAIKALEEIQQYRAIGTVEEIKEILQIISEGQDDVDESGISTGLLHTLLEYTEYKKIGTVEECREAKELQIPKKYKKIHPCKSVTYYQCPCCNGLLHINENFCGQCGQAISWEDEE